MIRFFNYFIGLLFIKLSQSIQSYDSLNIFLKWFNENGGVYNNKINLTIYDEMGVGVNAIDKINANEELFFIPNNLILSLESFKSSDNEEYVNISHYFKSNDQLVIITILLYEYYLHDKSFYYPYINVLPNDIPNLSFYSLNELKELQHPEIETSAINTQKNLIKFYNEIIQFTSINWPQSLQDKLTYDQFLWANAIVDSRGLRFQGKVYLVPLADMLNYQPHSEIRHQSNGEFFLQHHVLSNNGISILSDRSTLKNEQVFEDYGDNNDLIYLLFHGFVPIDNPFRCIKLVAPTFNTLSSNILNLIKQLKFQSTPSQCIDSNYQLNKALVVYLTTLSFNKKEIKKCEKVVNESISDWNHIFDECSYNDINRFLSNYINYRKSYTIKPSILLSNQSNILDSNIDTSLPNAYINSLNNPKSLESRVLLTIQRWIKLIHPSFPTTIKQDLSSYINYKLDSNIDNNSHYKTILLYRLQYKLMWYNLCIIYNIPYQFDLTTNDEEEEIDKVMDDDITLGPNVIKEDKLTLEKKVTRFNYWYNDTIESLLIKNDYSKDYIVNKLQATIIPNYRIGVITLSDISYNESYSQIPIEMIFDSQIIRNNENHPLYQLIKSLDIKFNNNVDHFHELLLLLIYEKFILKSESLFFPYLALLPTDDDLLDLPIYWSTEEINERLAPSYIKTLVSYYQEKVIKSFEFVSKINEIFSYLPDHIFNFDNYRWATAILDSRSIWWNGNRHLVPMLDFINCKEDSDYPNRIHSTNLDDTQSFVITRAAKDFKSNEQIFENYGQPNYIYFQYHGFTLTSNDDELANNPANSHDCVHYEFIITKDEGIKINFNDRLVKSIIEKLKFRSRAMLTTCLTYPIEGNIWLILALKMNNYIELASTEELGRPNYQNTRYLLSLLSERFPAYENYSSRHYESRKFIQSEYKLLKWIYHELEKSLVSLYDSNDNDEL